MEDKHMAVAFTGHRPETIPYIDDTDSDQYFHLEKVIWQEVHRYINAGYNTFYCGAARGADMLCGEIILSEKETNHPELKLICAIPFKEQARGWDFMEKLQYRELLRRADRIVQVCDSYQRGCYHVRNRYMVDNSDVLIAIYNGEPKGGTAYTVNYARNQGKEITIINPDTESEMNIPDYAIERLARTMLPLIQKYYESDEGRKELILWQENHK